MSWRLTAAFPNGRGIDVTESVIKRVSPTGTVNGSIVAAATASKIDLEPAYFKIENQSLSHWRPLTVQCGSQFNLNPNSTGNFSTAKVRVVYFINCFINKNFIYLLKSQMLELEATRLLHETNSVLYIVFSGTEQDRLAVEAAMKEIFAMGTEIQFVHHTENAYEYPGIKKVWDLGREDADALILYFHARGISRIKLGKFRRNRQLTEKGLFKKVIGEWRQNLLWLMHVPSIDKVGINCGGNGWLWFNFWWVRASYVQHLEEPVITERRHYYEDWLGRYVDGAIQRSGELANTYPDSKQKCLSIASFPGLRKYNLGSDFNPHDGETNLGLPFGRLRYQISKMKTWLRRGFGKST